MAKKIFKRFLPDMHKIRNHKHLRIFGTLLHDANLWHLNRYSASGAFAVELFVAFVPMPFQMIPATALAIYFRVNLPISVVLVWITNPITIPPVFYFCYKLGAWVLGRSVKVFVFEPTWEWLSTELSRFWQPFLLGCFIVSTLSALIGYFAIHAAWRWHVINNWEKRKLARAMRKKKN